MRAILLGAVLVLSGPVATPDHRVVPAEWTGPAGSSKPSLTRTPRGELLLSWLEPRPDHHFALRVAGTSQGRWSEPVTVADTDRFFVNWADFPSVVETTRGMWVVHWLEKSAAKSYAYDIRLATSNDRGRTWSTPITAHRDGTATEHGFVSMVPRADGSVAIAWLDGRQMADSGGTMSVRTATLSPAGRIEREQMLDPRTCECCQVSMTAARQGLVAVYRDRSDDEVRDIAVVREVGGRWTAPRPVAADRWVWKACPVNGPSVSAINDDVGVAWFTAAGGTPKVKVAFSRDGGATFGDPIRVDNGNTLGRIHFQLTGPVRGALVWLEADGDDAVWLARTVGPAGAGLIRRIARTSRARDAGFPRTALVNGDLWVAFAETQATAGLSDRVQVKKVTFAR